ncbi:hypothetical protein Hanom_Chr16g01489591 [Helianthus anomalus]
MFKLVKVDSSFGGVLDFLCFDLSFDQMIVFNYLYPMFKDNSFFFKLNVRLRSFLFACVRLCLLAFVCVRDQCSRTVREQLNFFNERT